MDISDAFMASTIDAVGVTPDEETTDELETWLREVIAEQGKTEDSQFTHNEIVNMAGLAFTAGRAYQTQFSDANIVVPVEMDVTTLGEFVQFLAHRVRGME